MRVSGQQHAPAVLYSLEWTPVPTGQEVGWASVLVWKKARGKILCLCQGLNPVIQSVIRHYVD
jgi:hypothetical protein